jgi:hypothetical protein
MDGFSRVLSSLSGACKPVIGLFLNIAVVLLVAGVVFDLGTYDIIANVSGLVGHFINGGLTGLVTLMVFLALWDR